MLTASNEFRVGRPQMIAGLLLLAFFCQCLWVAQTRHLSDVEFSYLAATHASRQGEQSPITSPFTVLAASLPLRVTMSFAGLGRLHCARLWRSRGPGCCACRL